MVLKKYQVSLKINPNAWLNKDVEAESMDEAKKAAKDFFTGIVGKDRMKKIYMGQNVVVIENKPLSQDADHQED